MFSPAEIKKAVQDNLKESDIPEGHKVALVTIVNNKRAEVTLATKINDHWNIQLLASHDWTGDTKAGVISKVTW
jgi:hypothetical protein